MNVETGQIDLSLVGNENIKNKLMNNPLVKYALLQREDQYNFPHLKNQKIIADELRREVNRLKRQEGQEKDEIEKNKVQEQVSGFIDKEIKHEYQTIEDLDRPNETFSGNELSIEALKYGSEYRLDSKNYLLESREERTLRLEEKWLRERLAGLSSLEKEETDSNDSIKKLKDLVEKTRRIKLKIDQEAMKNGAKLFFNEHNHLSKSEILMEEIPLERLENFRK